MIQLNRNSRFLKILVIEVFFWAIVGSFFCALMGWQELPYLLSVITAFVGLLILIKMIKILIESTLPVGMRVSQFIFFSFFKLVCLTFLAITLKRFQNLSPLPMLIGVSYYWVAPLIAGIICSKD